MAQPKTLHPWASDAAYSAPGEAWDATPPRVDPSSGESGPGWTPRGEFRAQLGNAVVGGYGDHLAAIVDQAANTYHPRIDSVTHAGETEGRFRLRPQLVSTHSAGLPAIAVVANSPTLARRVLWSPDGGQNWFTSSAALGSGDQNLTGMSAVKHEAGTPEAIVFMSSTGHTAKSSGLTSWTASGALPTTGNWLCSGCTPAPVGVARHIVAGQGKIAHSTGNLSGTTAWSTAVVPFTWAAVDPYKVLTPDVYSTARANEVLIIPSATNATVLASIDGGLTWSTRTTADGNSRIWADACWSPSHQVWLLLSRDGRLYSAPNLEAATVFQLRSNFGGTCYGMGVLGRNVIVTRANSALTGSGSARRGNVLVSNDLATWRQTYVWDEANSSSCYQVLEHDGRVALVETYEVTTSQYAVRLHWTPRLPSEIPVHAVSLTP